MSKPFAGFLLGLSLFMIMLALMFSKEPKPFFMLLWACIGGFSIYKLCKRPSSAS